MDEQITVPWQPTDYDIRNSAAHLAVQSGAKPADIVKTATEIYGFLTAGNVSAGTSKPATETAKPAKASAQSGDKPAKAQSSGSDAPKTTTETAASPSETASGFAEDGSELTKQDVIAAATKFVGSDGKTEADLVAVFGEFGASKLSELEPSDYAAVIARLATPVSGAFD